MAATLSTCDKPDCSKRKWGPPTWHRMHRMCADFPDIPTDEARTLLIDTLFEIGSKVPCECCSEHWVDTWTQNRRRFYGLTISKRSAFQMLYDIHNVWNLCLGKPFMRWDHALRKYGMKGDLEYTPTPLAQVLVAREAIHGWYIDEGAPWTPYPDDMEPVSSEPCSSCSSCSSCEKKI